MSKGDLHKNVRKTFCDISEDKGVPSFDHVVTHPIQLLRATEEQTLND